MLGDELKAARASSGMTQDELASRAKVHRTYISLLERGRKSPTLDVLFRICQALGVAPSKLIAKVEKAKN